MPAARLVLHSALLALLAPLAPLAPELNAQTPLREPAVVELPPGARAAALGHAYPLGTPDSDVLFANPALLVEAGGMTLGLHAFAPSVLGVEASAATEWFGGTVGVGVRALHHPTPGPGRRGTGGVQGIVTGGTDDVSELVASLGYGRTVAGFHAGMAAKLVSQRFHDQAETSPALDLGLAREVGPVVVGLAVRDLGPDRSHLADGGSYEVSLPTSVTLGASGYGKPIGPLDVGGALAVGRRHDGEVLVGGGIELGYWPVIGRTFVVRAGARRIPEADRRTGPDGTDPTGSETSPFTFGGAFWGDALRLEYAWQPMDGPFDDVHRVSIGWR